MSLANGETNKFFTDPNKDEDRYYEEGFTIENSYNNYVAILANEVPCDSIVLDIGCAQGKFGQALSEKQCTIYGVEKNPVSARHAINNGYYKDVFIYDISSANTSEYERMLDIVKQVDVIIIADVLEHLSDPTSILHRYSHILKDEGIILVSVPNIAHADIALNLLNGKFNYTDMGILDNTHLKFFTKRSFLEWIDLYNNVYSDTVFDCEYLNSSFYYSDYLTLVRNKYNTLFRLLETNKEFNALQLLFKLTKLPKGEVARNLLEALQEKPLETVDMIGSALEGSFKERLDILPTMLRSERSWYEYAITNYNDQIGRKEWEISKKEERINELLKYVSRLEEGLQQRDERIEALQKYISELEEDVQKGKASITQLEDSNEKLLLSNNELKESLEESQKRIDKLTEDLRQSRETIIQMEHSLSWKVTKFLRKK